MDTNSKDFVMEGLDASWFANTKVNDGLSFTRHPLGEYRGKIEDLEVKASQGANPHNMLVAKIKTIAVIDGDENAIGMEQTERYGSPQSPKFMQERLACLLKALDIKKAFKMSELIGREFDMTVIWEKGDPVVDPTSGEEKVYVNSRVRLERAAGSARNPKAANARMLSRDALTYLDKKDSGDEGGGERAPWVETGGGAGAGGGGGGAAEQPQWLAETEVPAAAHAYRAHIALGKPQHETVREQLLAKRINPDGEINVDHLQEPLKAEFAAWKVRSGSGLPSLDGNGAGGGAGAKPRTGTRAPKGANA